MAKYSVELKRSALKELEAVPQKTVRQRLVRRIRALGSEPRPPGCEKLSGEHRYRVRQGAYRIVYEIQDDRLIVTVVKVGHRKDVYRRR